MRMALAIISYHDTEDSANEAKVVWSQTVSEDRLSVLKEDDGEFSLKKKKKRRYLNEAKKE